MLRLLRRRPGHLARRFVAILAAGTILLPASPLPGQTATDPLTGFDAFAQRVLETWGAPGLAVAVVHDGQVVLERGWGRTLVGGGEAVDPHTVFAIASTTKAFAAATLGILVDRGSVSWDDPVIDHLPAFQVGDAWVTREITVRDLLSHRSGLPRGDHLWYLSPFGRDEVVERVRHLDPVSSFRSRYGYQNLLFITAGEVVEAVSGKSWDAFVREHIFTPLGMSRTDTRSSRLVGMENVATPHVRLDDGVVPIPWPDFDNLGAASAIQSSVHDMGRWIQLQLGGGRMDSLTVWSDSVGRQMWEPNTVIPLGESARRTNPDTHLQAYGLGWILADYRGRLMVRHGGSLDGMRAHVALVPEEGLGVVVLTNLSESLLPVAVVREVVDRFMGPRAQARDWNAVLFAEAERQREEARERRRKTEEARIAGTRPSRSLDAYAGRFRSVLSGDVEVSLEDGQLRLAYGPNYVGALQHWHFDTWRVDWRNRSLGTALVTFRLSVTGEVEALTLAGTDTFLRVEGEPRGVVPRP